MESTELKYHLNKNEWEYFVAVLGKDWVEKHCVLIEPIPYIEDSQVWEPPV